MLEHLDYKNLSSIEGIWGNDLELGIKISIASNQLPADLPKEIRWAASEAVEKLKLEILSMIYGEKDTVKKKIVEERNELLSCFPDPIYVEEIPNGYSSNDFYFRHFPWFLVTTSLGRIEIGWRKSVINIDWSKSDIKKTADELFPNEDVTKFTHGIHAHSLADAEQYVNKLLGLS